MNSDWKMELYWRLPISLQELGLAAYARHLDKLYYGKEFDRWREIVIRGIHRPWEESEKWQLEQLRAIVHIAQEHVPYYRNLLTGLDPASLNTIDDLASLPIVDRQQLRQCERAFLDDRLDPRNAVLDRTSGSTGTALTVYWPVHAMQRRWATNEVTVRYAAGVDRFTPRAMMGGRTIVRGSQSRPPFWRYNRHWNQLYLSSYHISPPHASAYVEAMRERGIMWLDGYGSAIGALAQDALNAGLSPLPLKAVVTSGDTLQPGMRRSIEEFFQCKCYNHYGQAEGVCWIMECAHGNLHPVPEFGIMEILRPDGTATAPGEVGEIVATGLLNDGMIFLRYRTGDTAAWALERHCPCGKTSPVVDNLEGRVDDYLRTADGRVVGRLSAAVKRSPSIHSMQIVQSTPGKAFLLVKPGKGYERSDAEAICQDIGERIGSLDVTITEVEAIPRTASGKARLVIRLDERPDLRGEYETLLKVVMPENHGKCHSEGVPR